MKCKDGQHKHALINKKAINYLNILFIKMFVLILIKNP